MPTFALQDIEIPYARDGFFKLVINNNIPLEESWSQLEQQGHDKLLDTIQSNITLKAQGQPIPPKKLKYLGKINKKDPYQAFEFRIERIRLYGFIIPGKGHILFDLHLKDEKKQHKMLAHLSKIMKEYYQELQGHSKK